MLVQLQLDYYMSAQFAGVALALENRLYEQAGLEVTILPDCTPGTEPEHVLAAQAAHPTSLCVGSIEQNVLAPYVAKHKGAEDALVAVAAMFGRSPLCLAALPMAGVQGVEEPPAGTMKLTVGAHEDTVALLQRLLPDADIVDVPREDKLSLLREGRLDAVQIYDCMESGALRRAHEAQADEIAPHISAKRGGSLRVVAFEELPGASVDATLGYAQVLFATSDALAHSDPRRAAMHRFLTATFEGWRLAIACPEAAATAVIKRQPAGIDHFASVEADVAASVRQCCVYVKRTSAGDGLLGHIDPARWDDANRWLLGMSPRGPAESGMEKSSAPGLDAPGLATPSLAAPGLAAPGLAAPRLDRQLWAPEEKLMLGGGLADELYQASKRLSAEAVARLGRRPRLCVISLGSAALGRDHPDADRRLELLGVPGRSWFDKIGSGAAAGIDVKEIRLPEETSTEQLLAVLRDVRQTADGVQLMWPLPAHIDALAAYSHIPRAIDADGAAWLATMELAGGQRTAISAGRLALLKNAPVTASAVIRLLDYYHEPIAGKRIVVVGRSRLCGSPLAFMFGALGGLVTSAHATTPLDELAAVCRQADILVPCVGSPGLIRGEWIKAGAVVVNVGTTFIGNRLLPDVPASLDEMRHAKRVASCPNGVGPLSAPILFYQTAQNAAESTPQPVGAIQSTPSLSDADAEAWVAANPPWARGRRALGGAQPVQEADEPPSVLTRTYHFKSYPLAIDFVASVASAAEAANHHPNVAIVHSCTDGVDVTAELFTYATKGLTAFDTSAARDIERIFGVASGACGSAAVEAH